MNQTCPNCGSDSIFTLNLLRSGESYWKCNECGTSWSESARAECHVPRRSRPAEVKELPDDVSEPFWWHFEDGMWKIRRISFGVRDDPGFADRTVRSPCRPGRYVRCDPPIVPPEPKDEDVQMLRDLANKKIAIMWNNEGRDRIRRIADRLEQTTDGVDAAVIRETVTYLRNLRDRWHASDDISSRRVAKIANLADRLESLVEGKHE